MQLTSAVMPGGSLPSQGNAAGPFAVTQLEQKANSTHWQSFKRLYVGSKGSHHCRPGHMLLIPHCFNLLKQQSAIIVSVRRRGQYFVPLC